MSENKLNIIDFSGVVYKNRLEPFKEKQYNDFVDDFLDLISEYDFKFTGVVEHMEDRELYSRNDGYKELTKSVTLNIDE